MGKANKVVADIRRAVRLAEKLLNTIKKETKRG